MDSACALERACFSAPCRAMLLFKVMNCGAAGKRGGLASGLLGEDGASRVTRQKAGLVFVICVFEKRIN